LILFFSSALLDISSPDALDLIEWFAASAALIIFVTLVYVYVLNKSPPPEGLTEAKLEMQGRELESVDAAPILNDARAAIDGSDYKRAVELSVRATGLVLSRILRNKGADPTDMNISDMAYIIQTKSPGTPDMTQPAYQLNLLHLKAERGEAVTREEADWSLSTANWFTQLESSSHI
jgi:hypothetical protein